LVSSSRLEWIFQKVIFSQIGTVNGQQVISEPALSMKTSDLFQDELSMIYPYPQGFQITAGSCYGPKKRRPSIIMLGCCCDRAVIVLSMSRNFGLVRKALAGPPCVQVGSCYGPGRPSVIMLGCCSGNCSGGIFGSGPQFSESVSLNLIDLSMLLN
jgi:hypothetical protein